MIQTRVAGRPIGVVPDQSPAPPQARRRRGCPARIQTMPPPVKRQNRNARPDERSTNAAPMMPVEAGASDRSQTDRDHGQARQRCRNGRPQTPSADRHRRPCRPAGRSFAATTRSIPRPSTPANSAISSVEARTAEIDRRDHQRQQDGRRQDALLEIGEAASAVGRWALSRRRHSAASGRRTRRWRTSGPRPRSPATACR